MTGSQALCAIVFGKEEDGAGFEFTQELVDTVAQLKSFLTGGAVPFFPTLAAHFLRPLVHLCISGAFGCSHQLAPSC